MDYAVQPVRTRIELSAKLYFTHHQKQGDRIDFGLYLFVHAFFRRGNPLIEFIRLW